jgi:hypothetical protein
MGKGVELGFLVFALFVLIAVFGFFLFNSGDSITGKALDSGDSSSVSRSFSGNMVNSDIVVSISVFINSAFPHSVYVIEETVPSVFTIVNSGGATVNGRVLRWSDFKGTGSVTSTTLTYTIRTPTSGTYNFSGVYGIDGMDTASLISGPNLVVSGTAPSDVTPPNFVFSTEYASAYSSTFNSAINVIWSDSSGIAERIFQNNFGGSAVNISGSSWSGVLGAGTYQWRSYARDLAGNWGSTSLQTFSIPKSSPNLKLSFNGVEGDISIGVGESVNVVGTSRKAVNLYQNGVLVSGGLKNYTSSGVYNFTAIVVADSNYTGDSISRFVTVSGTPTKFNIIWNSSEWLSGTTNFSSVNVSKFPGRFVNQFGEIRFLNNLSSSRNLDLIGRVRVGEKFAYIDSLFLPEFNTSAELKFYNIDFEEPVVLKDGLSCSECNILDYSDRTLVVSVNSFSTYSVIEGASVDDSDDSDDSGSGGSGGSSNVNIPGIEECVSNYVCGLWGECLNGSMKMVCVDQNDCEVDRFEFQNCGDEGHTGIEKEVNKTAIWAKIVAVIIVALSLIGVLIWFWLFRGGGKKVEDHGNKHAVSNYLASIKSEEPKKEVKPQVSEDVKKVQQTKSVDEAARLQALEALKSMRKK